MKIALLFSGGVDSAVALHLLREQGHDLHLFYIRIGRDDGTDGCTAEEDIEMCQLIATRYRLPFEVIPLHDEYWASVMQYSLAAVRAGLTPHPDMMCNKFIKFGYFEARRGHEFDATATGHYASIREIGGRRYLGTAVDPVKDQTDFLSQISYAQLSHALFPLGDLPKSEVRRIASEINLPNARRKDSQGICFLGKIDYNEFLRRHLGERPGPIVDVAGGKTIGEHRGYWFHTIGQRKGLGLSGGPWYVVRKDVATNTVYVSNGYDTPLQYGRVIPLAPMHWITADPMAFGLFGATDSAMPVRFKNRHVPEFLHGELRRNPDGTYLLQSREQVQGIAAGQFATIYASDAPVCLGSGTITTA